MDFSKSPNVVGTLSAPQRNLMGRSLILNGHVDVVPVGSLSQWTHPPFSGHYDSKSDKLYGRGITDMKAGLFACILALKLVSESLKLSGDFLAGDVIVQSVVEEGNNPIGAK